MSNPVDKLSLNHSRGDLEYLIGSSPGLREQLWLLELSEVPTAMNMGKVGATAGPFPPYPVSLLSPAGKFS